MTKKQAIEHHSLGRKGHERQNAKATQTRRLKDQATVIYILQENTKAKMHIESPKREQQRLIKTVPRRKRFR